MIFKHAEKHQGFLQVEFIFIDGLIYGAHSGLRQFLATGNSLEMMKNAFYFTLKALFV